MSEREGEEKKKKKRERGGNCGSFDHYQLLAEMSGGLQNGKRHIICSTCCDYLRDTQVPSPILQKDFINISH